ncbi:MAG: transposase domain-containing protein [Rhodospirillaceae bacterium]
MKKEWFTAAALAEMKLPDIPTTDRAIQMAAKRDGWSAADRECTAVNPRGVWRRRQGRGGGIEYHYSLLPERARAKLVDLMNAPEAGAVRSQVKAQLSAEAAWKRFEALSEARKEKARARLKVLLDVDAMIRGGTSKEIAIQFVCGPQGVPCRTYYDWEGRVAGVDRADWLPYLADHYAGRTATAEISDEAWEIFKADWLRNEEPSIAECYRRLVDTNEKSKMGWTIPSQKTLQRKIEREIDPKVILLRRKGREELERSFPHQRRTRSGFHALEAVNYDGHIIDVFTRWEDGAATERAVLLTFQDLYSGMIVGWRIDRSESAHGFRLAFLDVVEAYGAPDHVWSDNTMAAAAKENTGGTRFRHRFKIKDDDPVGLFADMGCEIHFTKPAHGQSKPIERAFGDLSRYISKAPECAGAYTGNRPTNKPANYGSKVVPIETLIKVAEREIARFNTWKGRNGATAQGRSYQEVFDESYAKSIIRQVPEEKRRMWMLSMAGVTCRKPTGEVLLYKTRYWHERLVGLIGKKVTVRFDPDHLDRPIAVYRLDGTFVCTAEPLGDVAYNDEAAAKTHGRKLKAYAKSVKELADASVSLGVDAVAAVQAEIDQSEPPENKVVRGTFGNLALKREAEAHGDDAPMGQTIDFFEHFSRGVALLRQGKE